jgi:hypothetical protein
MDGKQKVELVINMHYSENHNKRAEGLQVFNHTRAPLKKNLAKKQISKLFTVSQIGRIAFGPTIHFHLSTPRPRASIFILAKWIINYKVIIFTETCSKIKLLYVSYF